MKRKRSNQERLNDDTRNLTNVEVERRYRRETTNNQSGVYLIYESLCVSFLTPCVSFLNSLFCSFCVCQSAYLSILYFIDFFFLSHYCLFFCVCMIIPIPLSLCLHFCFYTLYLSFSPIYIIPIYPILPPSCHL